MSFDPDRLQYAVPRSDWRQRFRELVLYICKKCENQEYFGATKLNKILYYSDFAAYQRLELPITGAAYRKLKFGPAPEAMVPIRDEMIENGLVRIDERNYPSNRNEKRLIALREPDVSLFIRAEIEIVDEIIEKFKHKNGTEVSDLSHDIRWKTVEMNTLMPYDMVWLSDEPVTQEDIKRTRELAKQYGWA
ncbi:Panacea domain-containing protein [Hyphomonas sp. GM-8P]|uniref:Panacea domain-containing protein n=1 Tax=Hyphomonas sp. GM-8P TaxID=1280945 RepID=UPI0013150295|nr:Panacea domain-containing protein [Hyphomonas sp. GM-8P]